MTAGEQFSFAAVLDELCLRPGDRPRYTNVELAERIRADGGEITHTYISQLRRGDKDNPTCRTLEGLANALGVHPACFVGGRSELRGGERPAWRRGALKHLFNTVYPINRGPFSPEEVAARISGGPYGSISANYIRELLAGTSDNPRLKHILGLAEAFGAEPAYFFDDELAARVDEQLETRLAMDRLGVNTVIMRTAEQPPPPGVRNRILMALLRALHPDAAAEDAVRQVLERERTADDPKG
ncbi:helix-turn-helix domain-containing protein [Saccharothrix syringae]|uniref:XRE family transcriptional regulator n=1 Tax=Saccharothrix syringae TaxID=103733 RepID=A0A5Q0H243_SACSY|nr:helix-turn-helix transcriptional regulator [Saccharothrix syringae]QFZ20316.1 XRE family transcriptional regulator [Saccharothrix syringae]